VSFDRKQAQFKSRRVVICLPDRIVRLYYLIESLPYLPLFPFPNDNNDDSETSPYKPLYPLKHLQFLTLEQLFYIIRTWKAH